MRLRALDEPMHRIKYVHARRAGAQVGRIVRQDNNVLLLVPMPAQEVAHVPCVIHAPKQLVRQALVVNPDLPPEREYPRKEKARRQSATATS